MKLYFHLESIDLMYNMRQKMSKMKTKIKWILQAIIKFLVSWYEKYVYDF